MNERREWGAAVDVICEHVSMADRRRRRKINGSEESEEISDSSEEERTVEKHSELESSVESHTKVAALSEYGSAEEEDEEENSDIGHVYKLEEEDLGQELENPAEEEGGQESTADLLEGEYIEDDEEWKDEQREEGDGEESEIQHAKEKVLDFDEDRRNPQYIPKKGGFYEHDDRLTEVVVEEPESKKPKGKKKLWKDDGKWMHDRYQEDDQNPKSRDELIALYGYDIRNEDGPPRARRRRRYGRGPSKYTRKWEDEDAYGKLLMNDRGKRGTLPSRGPFRGRDRGRGFGRGGRGTRGGKYYSEEYPKLGVRLDENEEDDTVDEKLNGYVEDDQTIEKDDVPNSPSVEISTTEVTSMKKEVENVQFPHSSGDQSYGGVKQTRGKTSSRRSSGRPPRARYTGVSRPLVEDAVANVADDFERITIKDTKTSGGPDIQGKENRKEAKIAPTPHNSGNGSHERRQATVPPRLQDSVASRPKRYSSQRQRQVSDNLGYQQNSAPPSAPLPPRYYDAGNYQQPGYRDHSGTNNSPQSTAPLMPPPSFQPYEGAPYQEAYTIRPMASPPRIFPPVSLPAGQPVIPAPYIAPGGTMMNYGPPPATYTQFPFQYPAPPPPPPPPPVSQPQEIFRGGMAYYNAQPPVRTLPKRPRAAIPIVPPPEMEERRDDNDNPHDSVSYEMPHQEHHAVHVEN